jgi:carbamoyltransferase
LPTSFSVPRVLGLSGGSTPTYPLPGSMRDGRLPAVPTTLHDAAAVLVCGGTIAAGIEEERLNRLKHTNRLALRAITACLDLAALTIRQIDRIAYYGKEDRWDRLVITQMLDNPGIRPVWNARDYLADALSHDLKCEIEPSRLAFVEHHLAHATSAYMIGPFTDALVVTLDGEGDGLAGTVWAGERGQLTRLRDIPRRDSLGMLYVRTIQLLAYAQFDEYKVMGLAPYGDPGRFRHLFDAICRLLPQGRFEIKWEQVPRLMEVLPAPRRAYEPLTKVHHDLAAALQETIERATFHVLEYFRTETGLRHLCLAGGVAHNSTMIGKIARSGLFDGVFVQPASHDAGCALGAALSVHRQLAADISCEPLSHVYWGRDIGDESTVRAQLDVWSDIVNVRRLSDVAADTAQLIANGAVIGWIQGRSEFGPRALGNRSILADPRPAANKDRINALVKQRESYRPFAPAVLEEYAGELFEMPAAAWGAFMTFTVPVRAHVREALGAVTHVDGTARVQTVSRATNARFWCLIDAFRMLTGTPVLLNTSFNHSVEPIVDSIDDALTCFLTTGLSHLVVGDYLVTKRDLDEPVALQLAPTIPEYIRVTSARQVNEHGDIEDLYRCEHDVNVSRTRPLTREMCRLLQRADGRHTVRELIDQLAAASDPSSLASELEDLWAHRVVILRPLPERANKTASN